MDVLMPKKAEHRQRAVGDADDAHAALQSAERWGPRVSDVPGSR